MQYIFWNWQDNDSTKDLNHRFLGPLEPGRYRGFAGNLSTPGGMTLRLNQSNGIDFTLFDAAHTVEKRGVIFTKQGVMIQESGDIDLPISPNSTANARIDLVVCEHEYVDIVNGSSAIYYIIEGTPAVNPIAPVLTTPAQIKTIIGQLLIPAGTTALNQPGVVYTPQTAPYFNNQSNKLVDLSDIFLQNPNNDVPVDHMIISTGNGEFEDADIHNIIRQRNFKLAKTFEFGQSIITSFTGLLTNISTSGPIKNGLILTPDNKNIIVIDSSDNVVVDALPNSFQNGTELTFILTRGTLTFNTNSVINSGPTYQGWVELKNQYQTSDTETGSIVLYSNYSRKRVVKAYKFEYYWLLVEMGVQSDMNETNNKHPAFVFNQKFHLSWLQFDMDVLPVLGAGIISGTGAIVDYWGLDGVLAPFTVSHVSGYTKITFALPIVAQSVMMLVTVDGGADSDLIATYFPDITDPTHSIMVNIRKVSTGVSVFRNFSFLASKL